MTPPRLARWLLERGLDPRFADALIGDLDEIFAAAAPAAPLRAGRHYWARALGALWHLSRWRTAAPSSRGDSAMRTMLKDMRQGARLFVTQPGYTWAAVVTLALAIGANAFIFSIANVLVLKPLPIRDPQTLGWILANGPNASPDRAGTSLPEFATYRDEIGAFATLTAWRRDPVTLRIGDDASRVLGQWTVGDVQGLWGLSAVRGRTLGPQDASPSAGRAVVLSHRFWQTRFAAADDAVGRSVLVNGLPHTVVGVLDAAIELGNLAEIDLWIPYTEDPRLGPADRRGWRPVGRLAPGATVDLASAQVSAVAARLAREQPATNRDWSARVGSTREALGGRNTWIVLSMLFTVVGLLLVLACANIMNLLIARLIGRWQELAVRTALGASRGRIVRQIVAESLLIGIAGALAGLAVADAGLRGMHAVATEPFFKQVELDWRVVTLAFALALSAPLAFAILPTLRVLRAEVRTSLNDGTARTIGGARAARGRSTLVVIQVSLAVTLLVVSALVVQSMRAAIATDVGYDPEVLLSADVEVPVWKTADDGEALRIRRRLLEHARAIPGATGAALTTTLPALGFPASTLFDIAGRSAATDRDRPSTGLVVTSPDFFAVLGIPLAAGRGFEAADAGGVPVAVISQEAARRYWGGAAQAIGAVVRLPASGGAPPLEASIVGVSRDTADPMLDGPAPPMLFVLDDHRPTRSMTVVVRSATPAALAPALRAAIRDTDADLPAYRLRTVTEGFADETSSNQLLAGIFAAFAVVAVLLAIAGLYGVMAFGVSQRTPEIAVRLALGASTGEIARDVVGRSLRLTAVGAAIGLAGAFALAQTIRSILFGITPADPATYAGAIVVALVGAVLAAWIPMRRAIGVDPISSLRRA